MPASTLTFRRGLLALLALPLLAAPAYAETFTIDPHHTTVVWQADHFGLSKPTGKFPLITGTLVLDEAAPANSQVDISIDTTKLSTGDAKFDEHLKSKDFFDVATYPTATFKSTKVTTTGDKTATVEGDLTLHGVTKKVTLDVTLNKVGEHPMTKKKAAGFSATATIKRSDFGITYAIPGVADEVKLDIQAEAGL